MLNTIVYVSYATQWYGAVKRSTKFNKRKFRSWLLGLFDSNKKSQHYCQFSGGGNLYITKRVQPPLVFLEATQTDDDDDASTLTTSTLSPSAGNSPSRPPDNEWLLCTTCLFTPVSDNMTTEGPLGMQIVLQTLWAFPIPSLYYQEFIIYRRRRVSYFSIPCTNA